MTPGAASGMGKRVSVAAALAMVASVLSGQGLIVSEVSAAPRSVQTFNFVGSPQMYVVPDGVTSIDVTLNGAQGTTPSGGGTGGLGGRVQATISVTPGEVLQIMVGSQGGYNGGGQVAAAGGGATDIRRDAFSTSSSCAYNLNCGLDKRIIVAGGGGAGGNGTGGGAGGVGGSTPTAGGNGGASTGGGAASANAGGAAGTNAASGQNGATSPGGLGQGGQAGWTPVYAGGSGGGGYYGGGGGGAPDAGPGSGGGGGSSWASGTGVSAASFTDGANTGNGSITISGGSAIADATFGFTGAPQFYRVPAGVTAIAVNIAGGAGGQYGEGDVVYGQLPVTPDDTLQITIGGAGIPTTATVGTGVLVGGTGGYNGGGAASAPAPGRTGGGGASDVRVRGLDDTTYALEDRVIVAAGGGGAGFGDGSGWRAGAGGALANGTGGSTFRNIGEPRSGGGTLTAGGQVTDGVNDATTRGSFGQGGNGIACCAPGSDYGGGGGGYYGGAAGYGGGGGSSYASVTGPDPTKQGVGNVLSDDTAAPFKHLRGGSFGNGYAVITSMGIAVTVASIDDTPGDGTWTVQGTINPKSLATTPFAFWGPSQAALTAGGGTQVAITGPSGATTLAGDTVQAVSGVITGVPNTTNYYRVCARSVAGYSCGAVQTFGYNPPTFTASSPSTSGTVGSTYPAYTFAASGTAPITFSIASGSLPPGLTLNGTSGLLSGTPTTAGSYTFTVKAQNLASPDALTAGITIVVQSAPPPPPPPPPDPSPSPSPSPTPTPSPSPTPTPAPTPVPVPSELKPGESALLVDGIPEPVRVEPKPADNGLVVQGDGWTMGLDGLGPEGKPLNLGPDGVLLLQSERDVLTSGSGFQPSSAVDLFIDPPVDSPGMSASWLGRSVLRASNGTFVGTVQVDAQGSFRGTATLPVNIQPGDHVLQAVGLSPSGQTRALNLGVRVLPSLVLDQGVRKADGRHDRIRTTGSSTGIPGGSLLTPYIRYGGQKTFTKGKATIAVQSDGSFRWTRQIRKDKTVTGYVTWTDATSNQVRWAKVR